jgi:hypothetical protein
VIPGWLVPLILLLAVAAPLWHLHIINRDMPSTHADLVLVSTGVRATLAGLDPYSDQVTSQIQTAYYGRPLLPTDHVKKMAYAYPAYTAIVFAPLALASWTKVRLAFLILIPILMGASVPLWFSVLGLRAKPAHKAIIAILFLASWPVMWSLRLQQPTLIIEAALVFALFLLKHRWNIGAGVLLTLTTVKPQLVAPLLLWLIAWAILQRNWRFVASFLCSTALLILASIKMTPGWIPRWRTALADYAQYTHIHPDLQNIFGKLPGLVLMIAIATTGAAILWHLRRCAVGSPEFGIAVSLALAATVALLPTEPPMIYNYVLLFPALLILFYSTPVDYYPALASRIALGLVVWNFLSIAVAVAGETLLGPSNFWEGLPFGATLLPTSILVALYFPFMQNAFAPTRAAAVLPETA